MSRKLAAVVIVALVAPVLGACAGRPLGHLEQGLALYRDGRYEEAELAFDNAVIENPGNPAAYNNRAGARLHLGHEVAALGDYTRALDLSPLDPELHFNRAVAYLALGNNDFAIKDLNRAVELAPQYSRAYFNRGMARLRAGDRTGAEADWRHAIAIEPDPWTQAAMVRSAGISGPAIRGALTDIPGALTATAAPPPAPSALPAFSASSVLDARSLAMRGMARELDGDRVGAIADLRAAHAKETDPARQTRIADLMRRLEAR